MTLEIKIQEESTKSYQVSFHTSAGAINASIPDPADVLTVASLMKWCSTMEHDLRKQPKPRQSAIVINGPVLGTPRGGANNT